MALTYDLDPRKVKVNHIHKYTTDRLLHTTNKVVGNNNNFKD